MWTFGNPSRGCEVERSADTSVVPLDVTTAPEAFCSTDAVRATLLFPAPDITSDLQIARSASQSEADESCAEHRFPVSPRRGKRNGRESAGHWAVKSGRLFSYVRLHSKLKSNLKWVLKLKLKCNLVK